MKARAARRRSTPPVPEFARIVGVGDKVDTKEMAEGLQRFLGKPLDQDALGQALTRITGDGLYSAVTYDAIREDGRDGLLVHVDEKLTGPPLLNFALEVSNRASKGLSFDPSFRVTMFNTLTKNSEIRLDGSFGTRMGVWSRILSALRPEPLLRRAGDWRRTPHHRVLRRWRVAGRVPGAEGTAYARMRACG